MNHPYTGITAFLPTKHGKEVAIKAGFEGVIDIGASVVDVDTDSLGTFSGEVERKLSPFDTAVKKTELAHQQSGENFFIASEGSIGNDPSIPFIISDNELLIFRDMERNLIIRESHTSFDIKAERIEMQPGQEIDEFLTKSDFPRHGLIAKGLDLIRTQPIKGIRDRESLERAISDIAKTSPTIILENDFRAHQSPSRMANIETAARKLALRINQLCPECGTPGFGVVDVTRGVRCGECHRLNPEALHQEKLGCYLCPATALGKILWEELPAEKCIFCNP